MPEITDPRILRQVKMPPQSQPVLISPADPYARQKTQNDAAASEYSVPQAQIGIQKTQADMGRDARNEQRTVDEQQYNRGKDKADRRAKLRQEFTGLPIVKNYETVATAVGSALQAPKGPAGDGAVLYAYATTMDPNSAVREGEVDFARSVASKVEQLKIQYNLSKANAELPPGVRDQLLEAMRNKFGSVHDFYSRAYNQFSDIARYENVDPKQVVGPYMGELVAPIEEKYIRDRGGIPKKRDGVTLYNPEMDGGGAKIGPDGRVDYGSMSLGGNSYEMQAAGAGATSKSVYNAEKSAMIDSMVRQGIPYARANQMLQQKFPGTPAMNAKDYAGSVAHARQNPGYKGSYGFATDQQDMGWFEQRLNDYAHMPEGALVANYANAATAGIPGLLAGQEGRLALDTMKAENPNASLIGEVGGAVTGSLAAGGLINRGAGAIGGRLGTAITSRPAAAAIGGDMAYGATYGATSNPDNRLGGAVIGAAAAGAGNGFGRYIVAPGIKAAASTGLADRLRAGLGRAAAPRGLDRGQSMIWGASRQDDTLNLARTNLQDAADQGLPFSLADSAPAFRNLGSSASRFSPDVERYARQNLGPVGLDRQARTIGAIDSNLAPHGHLPDMVKSAEEAASAASRPYFQAAMQQPAVDDAVIRELLNTPPGAKAARNAYDLAITKGENPAELGMSIDSLTGQVRFDAVPTWRTLQYIKWGLDDVITKNKGELGNLNLSTHGDKALNDLRSKFTQRLGELNPDFARANAIYADNVRVGQAAESGYNAANPSVQHLDVARAYGQLPEGQQDAFRRGFATSLVNKIENQSLGRDPETYYRGLNAQNKLTTLFPEGAPRFNRYNELEDEMALTRNSILGGSHTQRLANQDDQFQNAGLAIGGDILASSIGAPPTNILGLVAGQGVRGAARWGTARSARARADRIGETLLRPDPNSALGFLDNLEQMARAREAWARKYNQAGSTLGAASGLGLLSTL